MHSFDLCFGEHQTIFLMSDIFYLSNMTIYEHNACIVMPSRLDSIRPSMLWGL